jgi:hypothetical protein
MVVYAGCVGYHEAAETRVWRNRIGRLTNTDGALQNLSVNNTSVTWLRGGTGPEVWRLTFESQGEES